jgi:hypothetical protein
MFLRWGTSLTLVDKTTFYLICCDCEKCSIYEVNFMFLKWFMCDYKKWGWDDMMRNKGDGPSRAPLKKHLKPSNAFKINEWFFTRDDKHVFPKNPTYSWTDNKVYCLKNDLKKKLFKNLLFQSIHMILILARYSLFQNPLIQIFLMFWNVLTSSGILLILTI